MIDSTPNVHDFTEGFWQHCDCPKCGAVATLVEWHVYPGGNTGSILEADYDCDCGHSFFTEDAILHCWMLKGTDILQIHPSDDMVDDYYEALAEGYKVGTWADVRALQVRIDSLAQYAGGAA